MLPTKKRCPRCGRVLPADRKSVENRGFGVAVSVSSVETMHERRYTVDDWRYDTAHCEQTENGQKS